MKMSRLFLVLLIFIECFLMNYIFINSLIPNYYPNVSVYFEIHIKSFIIMNVAFVVIAYLLKVYDFKKYETYQSIFLKLIEQIVMLGLFLFAIAGIRENRLMSNYSLLLVIVEIFICFFLLRCFYLYFIKQLRKEGFNQRNIILLGDNDIKKSLSKTLLNDNSYGLNIVNDISYSNEMIENLNFLDKIVKSNKIKRIYLFLNDAFADHDVQKINEYCENNLLTLKIVPQQKSYLNSDLETEYLDRYRILAYKELPFEDPLINFVKRAFDIAFSFFMILFVLSWLIPIMGFLIKITSKGSIFFLQERVGFGGLPFKIIKFRTMKVGAEKDGPQLAKDRDPRVTLIGRILRKYRIDELPQFINVLKGDMSIVGPRPEREFYVNQIIEVNPRYKRLHNLKPGITSMGQVYYGYAENIKEMSERLNYDLLYLNNYNFLMDLKIIWLTIGVMVRGKGK